MPEWRCAINFSFSMVGIGCHSECFNVGYFKLLLLLLWEELAR